ncbi:MAG: TolC family protein [Aquisalinus sp.]|nr:TolC family protein [Aquisalinus sp.]
MSVLRFSSVYFFAGMVSACAVGPAPLAPDFSAPETYQTNGEAVTQTPSSSNEWWIGFNDPELNLAINAARDNNLDIKIARQNVERVQILVAATRSDLFPTVDAAGDIQSTTVRGGETATSDTTLSGGVFMAFEPDLFGRSRRQLAAALADFDAATADSANIERLIIRTTAQQYINLRRAGARIALLDSSTELQTRTLDIVTSRFKAGLSPALDVDRASADLAQTRSRRSLLWADRQQAIFALAVLSGRAPEVGEFGSPEQDDIPDFTQGPDIGVPADILRQRPDVRAAEARLIAALARVGVEKADLYPRLRLPGQITSSSNADDFSFEEVRLSIAALVDVPLFDMGRRRAELAAQERAAAAAALNREQQILTALQEVENALLSVEALSARLVELEFAVQSSESAYRQLDALYREGLASFIDVLDAQRTLISTRESVVETEADYANAIVALYTSLMG